MDFTSQLDPQNTVDEQQQVFDLGLDDEQLIRNCVNELGSDISYWEQAPWLLSLTDKENIEYLLGIQQGSKVANPNTQTPYVDNRLFTSVRAMLAYATGQTAKPELLPSKSDRRNQTIAREVGLGLYQHALDHDVNTYFRLAVKNLITRKRGIIKLRYDENFGPFGDICTENVDPADIVIGRFSRYRQNPDRVYQKQIATIQQLVEKFPEKKDQVYNYYGFKRGVYSQTSRVVTYWECWFTYDDQGKSAEGVCWFIPGSSIILGKMQNPNWISKGSEKQQKITNMTTHPIKPFIFLNYWNTGRSFIDETCLFDQARPQQDILNKRGRQIVENADYANPRILANGALWDEADAKKFINKSPKTVGLLNKMDPDANINNAISVINPVSLPSYVIQDKYDARNEIDTLLGTPTQFRGQEAQSKNPTLGQDIMVKNQAAALQDDLVAVVNQSWQKYYTYLLQMMNTYLPDDYYVMVKGKEGEYNHIMLNQDNIDTNVRVTVTIDSTLPLDKQSQRATAIQLAQMNRIDDLSLFELLGMPDPEKLAERKLRWEVDRLGYMQSMKQQIVSQEADVDIRMLIANKTPEERDDYNESYLNHFNLYITRNEFQQLPPDAQKRITDYLQGVANKMAITEALKDSMLDPAGITEADINPPFPKVNVRLMGQLNPNESAEKAGLPPPQAPPGQPSPPKMVNPSQFGVR